MFNWKSRLNHGLDDLTE